METLPPEMLYEIGKSLPVKDLRRFRLTCRRCALGTFPVLARRFYVLNTVSSLVEFKSFLNTIPGRFTKELVIYQGEWPDYSRLAWERRSWLLPERYPRPPFQTSEYCWVHLTETFFRYQDFMDSERSRTNTWDIEILAEILRRLPNLSSIRVKQMSLTNPQLVRLRKQIAVGPVFNGNTDYLVQCLSQAASSRPELRQIAVHGRVHSSTLRDCRGLQSISSLKLTALVVQPGKKWKLSSTFPNLRELNIDMAGNSRPRDVLDRDTFASLRIVRLRKVVIREDCLLLLIENPALEQVTLIDLMLSSGSWRSCFQAMRPSLRNICYNFKGTFTEKEPFLIRQLTRHLVIKGRNKVLLDHFLNDPLSSWPFPSPDRYISFTS